MNEKKVDCYSCQYFKLSYQLPLNKICQSFGFKSEELPAITVYKSTGRICNSYLAKDKKKDYFFGKNKQLKDNIKEKIKSLDKKEWYG